MLLIKVGDKMQKDVRKRNVKNAQKKEKINVKTSKNNKYLFFILLSSFKGYNNYFGFVVNSDGKHAVTQSAAYNHCGGVAGVQTAVIFWKNALPWSEQAADERQTKLATVRMAAKHQLHVCPVIKLD